MFGRPKAFTKMGPEERAKAFVRMSKHPVSLIRGGIRALKTLAAFLWVATEDPNERPASYQLDDSAGPLARRRVDRSHTAEQVFWRDVWADFSRVLCASTNRPCGRRRHSHVVAAGEPGQVVDRRDSPGR